MCGCAGFDGSNSTTQAVKQQPVQTAPTNGNQTSMNRTLQQTLIGVAVGVGLFIAYKKLF
jgi:hypothetical protein